MDLVQSKVISIVENLIKTKVDPNSSIDSVAGWDSLQHIQILFTIEDEFKMNFAQHELENMRSISDIVNAVRSFNES